MAILYAQPVDPTVSGFHFESAAAFAGASRTLRDSDGAPVESFAIRFVDGAPIDAELFEAICVGPAELELFFDLVRNWTVDQKLHVIVAVRQAGAGFPLSDGEADEIDIDLHRVDSLHDLAVRFVEDGVFGRVPKEVAKYLNYDAIVRDLGKAYSMVTVAGVRCAYSTGRSDAARG